MVKMVLRDDLVNVLDTELDLAAFSDDVSNNGLQIEGKTEVKKILFAVDACQQVFDIALKEQADFIFVHHGLSWGGGLKRWTDINAARFSTLFKNDISLYGVHLPLDAHAGIGHNARLAAMAELCYIAPFGDYHGKKIGFRGELSSPVTTEELAKRIDLLLPSTGKYQIFGDPARMVSRVGIISGGGAYTEAFMEMKELSLECLVTGEMTHEAVSYAKEANVSVIRFGHYRSETPGVLAVMSDVKRYFDVDVEFLDLPTSF
jgi:dinuclear metal center YbgI/SA1388 family protein